MDFHSVPLNSIVLFLHYSNVQGTQKAQLLFFQGSSIPQKYNHLNSYVAENNLIHHKLNIPIKNVLMQIQKSANKNWGKSKKKTP